MWGNFEGNKHKVSDHLLAFPRRGATPGTTFCGCIMISSNE